MPNEIVFVGAGPIGLWTAIQIKLQNPLIPIVFKEKKETYTRSHTLLLKSTSFDDCLKDDTGIIEGIITELKKNPHIRTNDLEQRLKILALELGVTIDTCSVNDVESEIIAAHPEVAMIIGSDGVRSKVRDMVFGEDNAEMVDLAYTAQIKYSVKGEALKESTLFESYPLLKQSNYLASVNVGQLKDGKTPVTIQIVIDKTTYEQIKQFTYANPLKLLADSLDEQLPLNLLNDIKTHLGFRLKNGENIIIDDINLTASRLPQQRCQQVTLLKNGRYYGLIGDAALALSYFKGMNKGLQLATTFAKSIVSQWDKVIAKDPSAFDNYEVLYKQFADTAFKNGHKTNHSIQKAFSAIQTGAILPFQVVYFENNTLANFHRLFDIIHQASQFYIDAALTPDDLAVAGAMDIKHFLEEQMPAGLNLLKDNLLAITERHPSNIKLNAAIRKLVNLNHAQFDFYEKAYFGLAMSKVRALLEDPTAKNYQACTKLATSLKSVGSHPSLIMSSLLELVIGLIAISAGIAAIITSGGSAIPLAAPLMAMGAALTGHGFYKFQKNLPGNTPLYKALNNVISERGNLADAAILKGPVEIMTETDHENAP